MTSKFNPQMISLAREYRELTQGELAKKIGVTQSAVAQIENGNATAAGEDTYEKIADVLSFPESFFLQEGIKIGFGSSSVYYRKKASLTAADRKRIQSLVNLNRLGLLKMLDAVFIKPKLPLPRCDIEAYGDSPSKVASVIRAAWNLPDGPIDDLTSLVEKAGIIVIECDFGTKEMDGTCVWLADMQPLIFLNKLLPPDRYRFTLAHELGHLVMHDIPHETMEDEADEFAGELLMQSIAFKAAASAFGGRPTLKHLAQLKPYWKVSIAAMIENLYRLKMISAEVRRSLYIMMSNSKILRNEPQPFPKETPKLIQKVYASAIIDGGFDDTAAPDFLKLPSDVFKRIFASFGAQGRVGSHLRLV